MIRCQFRPLLLGLVLALVCAAVFGAACRQGFVAWDDDINVYSNPYLNPATASNTAHFWKSAALGPGVTAYRPVVYTVYSVIAQLAAVTWHMTDGGAVSLNPLPFHAVSLAVHILNVLLVFGLLRRLTDGRDWAAGAGAALFAFHPVQVEPVAWVTGLTDLLGAMFSLLALGQYLRWASGGGRAPLAAATVCFVLAVLSHPAAVAVPLMAIVMEHFLLGRSWRLWVKPLSGWLLLSLGAVAVTHLAEHVTLSGVVTPWYTRPLIAGDALAFYLDKLFWPGTLGIDYGRSPAWVLAGGTVWLTALVPSALGAAVWLLRKRLPWLAASMLLFVLALLPVLGLVPFRFQTYSTVADRYLYLALLGPSLALACGLSGLRLMPPRAALALGSVCGMILLCFCWKSALQVTAWQNSISLFQTALDANPRSWMAQENLGILLANRGDMADAGPHFAAAMQLKPDYAAQEEYAMGMQLQKEGHRQEAMLQFRRALQYEPDFVPAREALRAMP